VRHLRVDLENPDPAVIREGARILKQGGIVAYPTDTLYGLACDPTRRDALEALHRIKERGPSLRLPFIAADILQARTVASLESEIARRLAERFWPGPLTLVLPLLDGHPLGRWDWGENLAIRVPASAPARDLARAAGVPIPATSANLSGEAAAARPDGLDRVLLSRLDLLLDGGPLPGGPPSTVLDVTVHPPRLLRAGAISLHSLTSVPGVGPLSVPGA
jgi:L-threonylcarbamoyladenylate synthase